MDGLKLNKRVRAVGALCKSLQQRETRSNRAVHAAEATANTELYNVDRWLSCLLLFGCHHLFTKLDKHCEPSG